MASRKENEMLFKLSAQLGGNFKGTFSKAQQTVAKMQTKLQEINKQQGNIKAYQKQQKAVDNTRKKLETLQKQYDNIQKEMSETEGYSSSLNNKLLQKQLQIEKTTDTLKNNETKLNSTGDALRKAGVDTGNLTNESKRLESEYQNLQAKQEKVADNLTNESERLKGEYQILQAEQEEAAESAEKFGDSGVSSIEAIKQALAAAGIAVALKKIYDGFKECASAAIEFESGMVGIDKTTDLTKQELAQMSDTVKELSTEIPVTTDELTEVGETAGQLGIEKENLVEFTTVMSELGTATTMTANDGATMLAQFANITQMDPSHYENLGSTVVALGNNYATTEQKITDMSQGIAASGSLAKMSEADIMGISAAVTSLGIEAGMGSTAVSKLIVMGMKAAETGEGLEEMANIAGVSAEEFKTAWGQDATGALQMFISGLGQAEDRGESAISLLNELGINEARMQRVLLSLAQSGDLLTNSISTANTAWKENTALQAEAEKRYATTESQLTMLTNSYNNVKIAIGDALAPTIKDVAEIGTEVLSDVAEFIDKNPALVKGVAAFTATIAAVTAALTVYAVKAKIAAAATALFTSAIPGMKLILGITAGVGALAGVIAAAGSSADEAEQEYNELTATSKKNYDTLQDLNAEYEKTCELYGENSYEAWELQERISELSEEYEHSKETAVEYNSEIQELMLSISETSETHEDAIDSIDNELESSIALITKLEEMGSKTTTTAAEQEAMSAIIDELNGRYSGLGLKIDDVTGKMNLSASSIRAMAKAEAEKKTREADYNAYVAKLQESAESERQLKKAKEETANAEKLKADAQKEYDEALASQNPSDFLGNLVSMVKLHKNEGKAVEEASEAYEECVASQEELQDTSDDLKNDLGGLEDSLGISADAANDAAEASGNLEAGIAAAKEEADQLAVAYEQACNEAYARLQSQYDLWEQAPEVVHTSVAEMQAAADSNTQYFNNYRENIETILKCEIPGVNMQPLLDSLSDGTPEAAGRAQALADAITSGNTDAIAQLAASVEEAQRDEKALSDTMGKIKVGYETKLDEMEQKLNTTVDNMNMSAEAADGARQTLQGYINGLEGMEGPLYAKMRQVWTNLQNILPDVNEQHSPSKVYERFGDNDMQGYINGIESKNVAVNTAMAKTAQAALKSWQQSFSGKDEVVVGVSPYLLEHLYADNGVKAEAMTTRSRLDVGRGESSVIVNVTYNINGDKNVTQQLRSHNGELIELIEEKVKEMQVEADRRALV